MAVMSAAGQRLGQVARVQLPLPPVTHPPDSDIIDDVATLLPAPPEMSEAGAELDMLGTSPVGHDPAGLPDVPDAVREHLEEVGFIEIDAPHLTGIDRFFAADSIEDVGADQVVVRTTRRQ